MRLARSYVETNPYGGCHPQRQWQHKDDAGKIHGDGMRRHRFSTESTQQDRRQGKQPYLEEQCCSDWRTDN
jgi:hypothetical protein